MLGISRRSVCEIFRQRQNVAAVLSSSSSLFNAASEGDICGKFKLGRYSSIINFHSSSAFFMGRQFESTASAGNHTPNASDSDYKKEDSLRKFSDMSSMLDDFLKKITHRNDELKQLSAAFKGPRYSFQIFGLTFSWDFGWIRRKFIVMEIEDMENIMEVLADTKWIEDFWKSVKDFVDSRDDAVSKHFGKEEVLKTLHKSLMNVFHVQKEYFANSRCLIDTLKWSRMWLEVRDWMYVVRDLMGVLSTILLILIIAHAYATIFV